MGMKVRLGLIGAGGMGSYHAGYLTKGKIARCSFAAVCDVNESRLAAFPDQKTFTDSRELIRSGVVDAVLIATPHYFHTTTGIDALENGLHVLVEKPLSVHKADCERLIAAHKNKAQKFGVMFNQRTEPRYRKVKQLVEDGELGEITRVNWITTAWYRTEPYYASAAWRGTWKGEGGGVLINQCPHQLDLLQWIVGMPKSIRAYCGFGSRHNIEVEDEVTAVLEYPNGAIGIFIASTGETPGTDRLEICGDKGKVLVEQDRATFFRNEVSSVEFSKSMDTTGFGAPAVQEIDIPVNDDGGQHITMTQNFVDAILDGVPLIAPAEEGIRSLEMANAMVLSSIKKETIELPLDSAAYERELERLVSTSKFKKKTVERVLDMKASM